MKRTIAALAALAASTVVLAPNAQATTPTVLSIGGTGPTSTTTKPVNLDWLNHMGPATQVGYPAAFVGMEYSIDVGAAKLAAAVADTQGPVTVVGGSQGALVLEAYKAYLVAHPEQAPAPQDLTFVQYADPASKHGLFGRNPGLWVPGLGVTMAGPVDTPYKTTVIARQYDGAADWPDRQWNLLADANAVAGFIYLHPRYGQIDLTGVAPYEVDGNTTYYRIPTERLPLLQPLRDLGVDEQLVRALERPLKVVIDSAYVKPKAAPASTPAAPSSTPPTTEGTTHEDTADHRDGVRRSGHRTARTGASNDGSVRQPHGPEGRQLRVRQFGERPTGHPGVRSGQRAGLREQRADAGRQPDAERGGTAGADGDRGHRDVGRDAEHHRPGRSAGEPGA